MPSNSSQASNFSDNPVFQATTFTGLKMLLAGATQPIFVAKTFAQADLKLGFFSILTQTAQTPFKGVFPAMVRELKSPFKFLGAYLGNRVAEDLVDPIFSEKGAVSQAAMNTARGVVGGVVEGSFATGINAWRTYKITDAKGISYGTFLRQGNDGSFSAIIQKALRGFIPTIVKQGAITGGTFAALDIAETYVVANLPASTDSKLKKIAKSVATGTMVALPVALFDTALVHLQKADAAKGKSFFSLCGSILRDHGVKGLVRGSGFNVILITVGATLNGLFFDAMKKQPHAKGESRS